MSETKGREDAARRARIGPRIGRAVRATAACAVLATIAACGSHPTRPVPSGAAAPSTPRPSVASSSVGPNAGRYAQDQDGGPAAPPVDVTRIPEPVPKAEAPARFGNKSPYTVLGRTYTVMPSAKGYVERGVASWYGNKFHGYMTSTFEPYDMYAFSAAHKTLPLPSYARVTNLENGKSVVVRVNDRGPFHDNRIIDLSYAAAVKIGVWPKGTGLVEVRSIDPGRPEPALPETRVVAAPPPLPRTSIAGSAKPPPSTTAAAMPSTAASSAPMPAGAAPPAAAGAMTAPALIASAAAATPPAPAATREPRIFLQLGAYGERANAERVAKAAERAGIDAVRIDTTEVNGRAINRVRIGPLANVEAADSLAPRIEKLGFGAPRVSIDD